MKIYKLTYGLIAATMLSLASCVSNDYPEFSDSEAFVAITKTTAAGAETSKTLEIPVMLTSLAGLQGSVDFVITPDSAAGAVEGTHYTVANSSRTLTFTKEEPVQNIVINIIDNDVFEGDKKFTVSLSNVQGAKLGANVTCDVTIEDDEHPLAFILGPAKAKGASYYDGETEWEMRFEKDAEDISKVWIYGLIPGTVTSKYPVYGTVNEDKTELHIPLGQVCVVSSSYPLIKLGGFKGVEGEEDMADSDYLTFSIAEDGTMTAPNDEWYVALVYSDEAGANLLGYWDLIMPGTVIKMDK